MPTPITLASLGAPPVSALAVRMVTPWIGNWLADVELDPELPALPKGPAVLTIGTTVLKCVVDADAGGSFGPKAAVRVVGGLGKGWDSEVLGQDFANDAGVTDALVIAATASAIAEVATVVPPKVLSPKYFRSAGTARRVLDGSDWHVDPTTGTTLVSPRIPELGNPLDYTILDFDPIAQRAEIACDAVLAPGTILVDPRAGKLIVRDVEQRWTEDGPRAMAWTGDNVTASKLAGALQRLAYEACGVTFLRSYVCRVVLQAPDGRLALQPIKFGELNPTTVLALVPMRFGIPGVSVKVPPGTEVVLRFGGGDPSDPYVSEFAGTPALEIKIGAATALPLTPAPWSTYLVGVLQAFATACEAGPPGLSAAATALAAALLPQPGGPMPLPATLIVKGA